MKDEGDEKEAELSDICLECEGTVETEYKEDLDLMRCDCGRNACEDAIILKPSCHDEGLQVDYFDGVLTLRCFICDGEVARVAVAKKENQLKPRLF